MSPLTKILIVVLTVASVFLCAMVVSYVANAENYKEQYENLRNSSLVANQQRNQAEEDLKTAKAKFENAEKSFQRKSSDLNSELLKVQGDLSEAKREQARLLEEQNKYKNLADNFQKTMDHQGKMLEKTQAELEKSRAEGINLEKELNETSNTLIEKLAVVDSLQKKIGRLEKEKSDLLARLNEPLKPYGKVARTTVPQTPGNFTDVAVVNNSTKVLPVMDIDIKALVKAVDMKNSMASVSVGSADGVTLGMRFHVTRGSQFICDIIIISVDVEEAVGKLDLVQQQPMAGDNASTNF